MVLMNASGLPITPKPSAGSNAPTTSGDPTDYIVEACESNFMTVVIEASQQVSVLVDFWAPWCEPCKQYTPILEKAIRTEKGRVKLVKINVDDNPTIAQQFQIRSLPTTMVFLQGRPLKSMPGVLSADTLKKLLSDLLKMTGMRSSVEEFQSLVETAEAALGEHNHAFAQQQFEAALRLDPESPLAAAGVLRALIGANAPDEAQTFHDALTETVQQSPEVSSAMQGLALLGSGNNSAVVAALAACKDAPDDLALQFALAEAYLEANQKECAVEQLLGIVARDRAWQDKAAQAKLLEIFAAIGFQDPLAKSGRQHLSALLFS
ncbi:MAG: thioredoxin [Alphaproteobacteria bacterium]|nr:thioredoxin [Alphaproteobacteria bacterium]